jgi:hypothetical protein
MRPAIEAGLKLSTETATLKYETASITSYSRRRTARNPAPKSTPSRTHGSGTSTPSAPTNTSWKPSADASPTPCAPSAPSSATAT